MKTQKLTINNKEYVVRLHSFDDRSGPDDDGMMEYVYEGFNLEIEGEGVKVKARKYKNENCLYIHDHQIEDTNKEQIELFRSFAEELYKTREIKLLGIDGYQSV